jgi:hypothetical protein
MLIFFNSCFLQNQVARADQARDLFYKGKLRAISASWRAPVARADQTARL